MKGDNKNMAKPLDSMQGEIRRLEHVIDNLRTELAFREAQLQQVIDVVPDLLCVRDVSGVFLHANKAFAKALNREIDQIVNKKPHDLFESQERTEFIEQGFQEVVRSGKEQVFSEQSFRDRDGNEKFFRIAMAPFNVVPGQAPAVIALTRDVTEEVNKERRLKSTTHYDQLTGLANRTLFRMRVKQALARSMRTGKPCAVMLLDIDHFREINETLGHAVGDELLIKMSHILRACIPPETILARLSADEFAIIYTEAPDDAFLIDIVHRIQNRLEAPLLVRDARVLLTLSIGIAVYPRDAEGFDDFLRNIDLALSGAKRAGGKCHRFFDPGALVAIQKRQQLANDLRNALDLDEFSLNFQPIISARNGKMIGMEALLRWQREDGKMISPAEFIPIAEQTGLILPIGDWVIRTACRQMAAWDCFKREGFRIAVNISSMQFQQKQLPDFVAKIIAETGIAPDQLEFEITESTIMEDVDAAIFTMRKLRDIGINLAIDDFGTGYSSLSYLKRFPIHKIKIDRSFVKDLEIDAESASIVRAIINLAHTLGMTVVAEGVETPEQLGFLQMSNCDSIQGYLYSKPISLNALKEWITRLT